MTGSILTGSRRLSDADDFPNIRAIALEDITEQSIGRQALARRGHSVGGVIANAVAAALRRSLSSRAIFRSPGAWQLINAAGSLKTHPRSCRRVDRSSNTMLANQTLAELPFEVDENATLRLRVSGSAFPGQSLLLSARW
jgi:hypothetical protein